MILSTHGIIGSSVTVASGDADALAFFTAATITDTTQKSAINTLVTDLKTANIWTKMKAIYPFVGGTAAQHRFNLKDPRTVDAAFYLDFLGGGTHSANGYQPNGTTSYADTKLTPSLNYSNISNISIGFYSRTNAQGTSNDIGIYQNDTKALGVQTRWTDNTLYAQCYKDGSPEGLVISNLNSSGFYQLTRTSTTSLKIFRNSSILGTSSSAMAGAIPTLPICISNNGNNGSFSAREQALSFIADGLTDGEAAAFYTAVQAYNTTLNRQV